MFTAAIRAVDCWSLVALSFLFAKTANVTNASPEEAKSAEVNSGDKNRDKSERQAKTDYKAALAKCKELSGKEQQACKKRRRPKRSGQ